jgi:AcrR family transcriptional regulator
MASRSAPSGPSGATAQYPRDKSSLTPRGLRRRDALIQAAAEIFARQGYHQTTVSDIVESQKVAKGVFYWYFSSKEDLLAEILKDAISGLRRAQAEAISGISDPLARIAAGIEASLSYVWDNQTIFAIFEQALGAPGFEGIVRSGHRKLIADTIRHLEEGIRLGRIRDADPEVMAHEIFGTMTYVARYLLPVASNRDSLISETVRYCVNAIAR